VVLSGILSLVVWVIIMRLFLPETHQEASREDPWLHAVICAAALVIGGILFLAVAPVYIGGVVGTGFASRVNFVMTFGMAFVIPAVLGLAVSSGRFAPWAALLSVFFLIYVGFTSSFLDIQELFHPSTFSIVLNEYSLKHRLVVFGYIIAVIFLTVITILSVMIRRRQLKHLATSDRLEVWWSRIRRQFVPATIACLVFFGSLFHFSVKEEYIAKWDQHKSMLEQLRSLAPALKNDTFVMIIRNQDDPVSPFHHEVTSYLFALYNNKSIMGNVDWQLSFHSDGINPTDAKLPTSNRLRPRSRISYDRLLMLEFDGDKLKLPSKVEVKTEEGERLVVFNNPDRILTGPSIKTVVWRYLD